MSTKFPIKTINYETTTTSSSSVTGVPSTYVNLEALGAPGSPSKVTINTFNFVNTNLSAGGFRLRFGTATVGTEVRADAAGISLYLNGLSVLTVPIATTGLITLYPGITAYSDGVRIRSISMNNFVVDSSLPFIEWFNTSGLAFTFQLTITTTRTQ